MTFIELLLIAVGLSMDAFAASVCKGLCFEKFKMRHALTAGLYFGVFQALMPLIGYFLGITFAAYIDTYDHWIAFGLLAFIGGRMIAQAIRNPDCCEEDDGLHPKKMLLLAVATSIDAMAVGVSFALLDVRIVPSVITIGVTTLIISIIGVKIGHAFGGRFKSKAELAGGVILVLIGLKILIEHLAAGI
ncbi:MAG: manganese efflux pump MntP family protein [Christensenellales bacterium]